VHHLPNLVKIFRRFAVAVPTLTNTPTPINNADSVTGWTGEGGLEPDIKVEGTNSVFATLRSDGASLSYDSANFTGTGQHVRGWLQFTSLGDLDFFEMNLNNAFWNIFRGATSGLPIPQYRGGWFYAIIDFDSTPNTGTKTNPVTSVGYRFQRTGQPRNVVNCYADVLYYGDGYTATGGTSGDPITFATIADVDVVSAYGIVQSIRDTNFLFGAVTIGNGATATYMTVENEAVIFADAPVASDLYWITATGSGCTFDATNSLFKGNAAQTFGFDMSAVGTLICNGNVFIQASPLTFTSGQTINSNTFIDCGSLTTGGATINRGSFTTSAPVIVSDISQLSLCTFVGDNTRAAVELTSLGTGTMDWSCIADDGYNAGSAGTFTTANDAGADGSIFVNVGSGSLTINVIEGGTIPSIRTAGATVTVQQSVVLTLENIIAGSEVRLFAQSDLSELGGGIEQIGTSTPGAGWSAELQGDGTYTATYSYSYGGSDVPVFITVLDVDYQIVRLPDSLTAASRSIKINQIFDRNYSEGLTPFVNP